MKQERGAINCSLEKAGAESAQGINVKEFIKRYDVEDIKTKEALKSFPTLCFLLGKVTDLPQTEDKRPDGIRRPVFFLTEGSGIFGLKHPEDADRWKGIFNHVMGSSRHVFFLSELIKSATTDQKQQFQDLGFDLNTLSSVDPQALRDFMFTSHSARRQVDERKWHHLRDKAHPEGESEELTLTLLEKENAPRGMIDLMRTEDHMFLSAMGRRGYILSLPLNILTYSDWTFGQKPNSLEDRFKELRLNERQPAVVLDELEGFAKYFEKALVDVFGESTTNKMLEIEPYDWEKQIREAYCAASGTSPAKLFPSYF